MQYTLPNNIEKQRRLRGASPKELYIPFNTGRRTGIKENTDRDSLFTTRPAMDKLKLSKWINDRINDGTIQVDNSNIASTAPAAQHLLTSAVVNGEMVWVPIAARRASSATFTTNGVGEFTVTLPTGSFPSNSYVVNIIGRNTAAVYFFNIVNKTASGFTVKVFNNSGATVNDTAITIDYGVIQS